MSSETEKLIDAVRQYPFLYDTSHASYKDKATKSYVWSEIATELEMENGDAAKTKWRNLKDSYLKYKRNVEDEAAGQANIGDKPYYKKYQKWPWAEKMDFFDGHYGRRENTHMNEASPAKRLKSTETLQPSTPAEKSEKLKTDFKPKTPASNSAVKVMIDYLEKRRKGGDEQNHVDNLFLAYANTFKTLSTRSQIDVKLKMAQLFAQAEIQDMKRKNREQSPSPTHSN